MATKTRAKGGAAPGAPKPKVEPRKTPFTKRTWVRRTAAVALVLLALWIAMFTWGRVSRSSALRSYTTKLFNAGRPFFQDVQAGQNSMQQAIADFKQGTMSASALKINADKWNTDFLTAGDAMSKVKPPSELKGAHYDLLIAMAEYDGIARQYVAIQQQSDLANAIPATLKKQKQAASDLLQLMLQNLDDARARADAAYSHAIKEITALAAKWHVKIKNAFPSAPGLIPPPAQSQLPPNPVIPSG